MWRSRLSSQKIVSDLKRSLMNSDGSKNALRDIEGKLQEFPHSHRLAFAAACCERAYPNYLRFFQLVYWGGPAALRAALDNAWAFIENPRLGVKDIEELEEKCKAVTPDLDEFSSAEIDLEAAAAQEATFMIRLLLQFCKDNQVSYALRIATFAMDTIDMYIQAIEGIDPADPRVDEIVAEHPLMQREVCKQKEDTSRLAEVKTQADLHEFRKEATHLDRSNVGMQRSVRSRKEFS